MFKNWREYYEVAVEEHLIGDFDRWLKTMDIRYKRTKYPICLPSIQFRIYEIDLTSNKELIIETVNKQLKKLRS